ncbi:MAG: hypothetical protein LBQ47_00640 [Endomicrobium sp.]|jgi:hypothetical protein|nr:hypothetical protein [Endomicrobium sp.]
MEYVKTSYSRVLENYAQLIYKKTTQRKKEVSFDSGIFSNDIDDLLNDLERAVKLLN